MTRIIRATERAVRSGGQINPSIAQQSALAQAEAGKTLQSIGDEFFHQAKVTHQNALFSKFNREATLSFLQRVQDRTNERFDEDGNPTFGTLTQDIGSIGNEVRAETLSKIKDPEVANKFALQFDNLRTNTQLKGMGEQRRQQLEFIQEEDKRAFEAYSDAAGNAGSPEESEYFVDQYMEFLQQADGAYSPGEIEQKTEQFRQHVSAKLLRSALREDPFTTRQRIENAPESLLLNSQEEQEAAISLADKAIQGVQKIVKEKMETEILRDVESISEDEIDDMVDSGQLSITQGEELRQFHIRQQRAQLGDQNLVSKMTQDLQDGKGLREYSPGEVDKLYKAQIQILTDLKGEPLSLKEQAEIAGEYGVKVPVLVEKLEALITEGDLQGASDALAAYDYLRQKSAFNTKGMESQSENIAEKFLAILKRAPGMSQEEALRIARTSVLDADDPIRVSRERNYKKILQGKSKGAEGIVEEVFEDMEFGPTKPSEDIIAQGVELYKEAYLATGDEKAAAAKLQNWFKGHVGESRFSDGEFMFMPPELLYPGLDPDDIESQLQADVAEHLGVEDLGDMELRLVPDEFTGDVNNKNTFGSYRVDVFDEELGFYRPLTADDGRIMPWKVDADSIRRQTQERKRREHNEGLDIIEKTDRETTPPFLKPRRPHAKTAIGGVKTDSLNAVIGKIAPGSKYHGTITANLDILADAGINTPRRLAHFLGQMAHESMGFTRMTEARSDRSAERMYGVGTRVGKVLGNTRPGDGAKYKGRGYIQLTGRYNYTRMGQKLGIDLVNDPKLAAEPEVALKIALIYWNEKGLSKLADQNKTRAITKKINGGFNGLADRIARTNHALKGLA